MEAITSLASTLQQELADGLVTTDSDTLHNYPVNGILPQLIVTPEQVEDVSRAVALAHTHGANVLPYGGGTRIDLGGIPERIDILLLTTQLQRLLEYEPADLTCHVEAGMTLATLQAQLTQSGQHLALDPPFSEQATIGGLLASNASGPKRLRYGSARDLVIGLRVVQANGEITRSGGRVVKNVAGYDLNKLYVGSLATLGILVEANFKLHPLPAAEKTLLLHYSDPYDAMQTVIDIMGSLLTPSALELIDARAALDMADLFGLHISGGDYTLAVNFEGNINALQRQVNETLQRAKQRQARSGELLEGGEQAFFWEVLREHTRGTITCKVSLLMSQVAPYLQLLEDVCDRHQLEAATIAHAGNGILYIELFPADATPRLVIAINELREHARALRGHLVMEDAPVELKHLLDVWGEPGSDFRMMQRLKEQFDPTGTFVKGRFIGGL